MRPRITPNPSINLTRYAGFPDLRGHVMCNLKRPLPTSLRQLSANLKVGSGSYCVDQTVRFPVGDRFVAIQLDPGSAGCRDTSRSLKAVIHESCAHREGQLSSLIARAKDRPLSGIGEDSEKRAKRRRDRFRTASFEQRQSGLACVPECSKMAKTRGGLARRLGGLGWTVQE